MVRTYSMWVHEVEVELWLTIQQQVGSGSQQSSSWGRGSQPSSSWGRGRKYNRRWWRRQYIQGGGVGDTRGGGKVGNAIAGEGVAGFDAVGSIKLGGEAGVTEA